MATPYAIAIIGTGRVARAMGRLLVQAAAPVVAVAGRDLGRATDAAAFIGSGVRGTSLEAVAGLAERLLIAVPDRAIADVAKRLAMGGMHRGAALHTAGVVGAEALAALAAKGVSCGALHPLQTVPTAERGVEALRGSAFGVTAEADALRWAQEVVDALEGIFVCVPPAGRAAYHAAAVMASNHLVALLDAAEAIMERAGVPRREARRALAPLIRASVSNALLTGPETSLTGPVERGDVATVSRHLEALAAAPHPFATLYQAGAAYLLELAARRGVPADRLAELRTIITERTAG